MPLHRQSVVYAREGVELDRSTLADWIGRSVFLLEPLAEAIMRHVRAGSVLHADDTPVPVLDPGRKKTKTGRLWVAVRDERPWGSGVPPAVFYRYAPDRTAKQAEALLSGCQGFLHADAYAGFNRLYQPDPITGASRFTEVACWAHARRKVYEVHASTASPAAEELLQQIGELFAAGAALPNSALPAVSSVPRRCLRRSKTGLKRHWPGSAPRARWHTRYATHSHAGRR
jgi:hypothetical protein